MSRRIMDMLAESVFSQFLDEYFYKNLLSQQRILSFHRIKNPEEQRLGVDVVIEYLGKDGEVHSTNIDEKSQLYYMKSPLPTFAIELQFLLGGVPHIGWFLNKDLKTDHYFLLFPQYKETNFRLGELERDKFKLVDGLMIRKSNLQTHLNKLGFTYERLFADTEKIRNGDKTGRIPTDISGINYFKSEREKYSEEPINLVISKEILIGVATSRYSIDTSFGIKKLK